MRISSPKYTEDELLDILKKESVRLGKNPTEADFDSNKRLPCSRTYGNRFGNWRAALEKVGLIPTAPNALTTPELEIRRKTIMDLIVSMSIKVGRAPKLYEMGHQLNNATVSAYFGSWNDALIACGLNPSNLKKEYLFFTDDQLLDFIKSFYAEHGQIPKISDFNMKEGVPSPAVYKKRFGGWGNAIRKAGFEPRPFPFRPVACDLYETCPIKQGNLKVARKGEDSMEKKQNAIEEFQDALKKMVLQLQQGTGLAIEKISLRWVKQDITKPISIYDIEMKFSHRAM